MPLDLTDDKSTLVQVMAWCRQATNHYLNQCWPRSPTSYGVTRPQWVKDHEDTTLKTGIHNADEKCNRYISGEKKRPLQRINKLFGGEMHIFSKFYAFYDHGMQNYIYFVWAIWFKWTNVYHRVISRCTKFVAVYFYNYLHHFRMSFTDVAVKILSNHNCHNMYI